MARQSKREQIMQVAEKLFSSKRFHEITLDEIAKDAHIGKGTIYTYFKDKDDLFFQVATSGFNELCDLLVRRVAEDAPFNNQIFQACEAITAFFMRRRHLFRMIQTEDARMSLCRGRLHERWFEKRHKLVQSLGKILTKGQLDGLVRKDLPAETLAVYFLGLLRARGKSHCENENMIDDRTLVSLFLHGACKHDDETAISDIDIPIGDKVIK